MPIAPPPPDRKWVKPAHPDAKIPDLDHGNFLPSEGSEVNWSVHWAHHEKQGNVVVSEIGASDAVIALPPPADMAEPAASAPPDAKAN